MCINWVFTVTNRLFVKSSYVWNFIELDSANTVTIANTLTESMYFVKRIKIKTNI